MNQSTYLNQNKTNSDYRKFLIQNTNSIMKQNFQNKNSLQIPFQKTNTYPYLFNGIDDTNKPRGYQQSLPKENYIMEQSINSKKLTPLQINF